eukprot:scaffold495690_cov38-Prasinocladus_malaysianus.AAC.2
MELRDQLATYHVNARETVVSDYFVESPAICRRIMTVMGRDIIGRVDAMHMRGGIYPGVYLPRNHANFP